MHLLYIFTAGILPDAFCELEKGESVLLENTEETKSALFLLINKYILLKVNILKQGVLNQLILSYLRPLFVHPLKNLIFVFLISQEAHWNCLWNEKELVMHKDDWGNIRVKNRHLTQYLFQGVRLLCSMLAAAVLRRHLMVWKIFAPKFIFEVVGFGVTLLGLSLGYLIFIRTLAIVSACYAKFKLS